MAIIFHLHDVRSSIEDKMGVKRWLKRLIEEKKRKVGDIIITLCSDSYINEVNIQYLSHDYPTDIITFNYNEGEIVSGDLLISIETVQSNAKIYNQEAKRELRRVMAHGVLHLLGYDDHSDEDVTEMRLMEEYALEMYDKMKEKKIDEI